MKNSNEQIRLLLEDLKVKRKITLTEYDEK